MESPRAVPSPRAAGVKRKGSLLEAANGAKALRPASTDNVKREKVDAISCVFDDKQSQPFCLSSWAWPQSECLFLSSH
jgi:hypothetical protein